MAGSLFPFLFIFLAVASVALFTFLAVMTYSENRTKERMVYYQQETYKKLADGPPEKTEQVLEAIREERLARHRR